VLGLVEMDRIGSQSLGDMERTGLLGLMGIDGIGVLWIGLDNEVWGFVKEWVKGLVDMDGKG
jgi:hypothetical protein